MTGGPGDDALLRRLGVRYVAFHRGLAGETGWFAWRELLDHGFGQVARDDGVTMLERGRSGGSSPVAEPGKRVVFCEAGTAARRATATRPSGPAGRCASASRAASPCA